jgi:quaternary ammonium compound-resistance protein SugE
MSWILLTIAGLMEVCWAIGLKYTEGFSKPIPSVFTGLAIILSMYLLAKASETLPIGTAYAVWVGIGAAGASILGIILFNESVSAPRIFFLSLLIISIVGLKFTAGKV